MSEYLGFLTAILVLAAALLGLIPPVVSLSRTGGESDRELSKLLGVAKPIVVIFGLLAIYFFYFWGFEQVISYDAMELEHTEIVSLTDEDLLLVANAERINGVARRDEALVEIVDQALVDMRFPLATFAASKIRFVGTKDDQLQRVHDAILLQKRKASGEVEAIDGPSSDLE